MVPSEKHFLTPLWKSLNGREAVVLMALMLKDGKTGCHPGLAWLEKVTRLKRETIWRAIDGLKNKGALHVSRRRGKTNYYDLSIWREQHATVTRGNGVTTTQPLDPKTDLPRSENGSSTRSENGPRSFNKPLCSIQV